MTVYAMGLAKDATVGAVKDTLDNGIPILGGDGISIVAPANALPISDTTDKEYVNAVGTASLVGNNTVYTPAVGKRIRLHWIYAVNDPTASAAPLIKVLLGGTEYYRVYAVSKRQQITGPINGALIINLNVAGNVAVTAILEEV